MKFFKTIAVLAMLAACGPALAQAPTPAPAPAQEATKTKDDMTVQQAINVAAGLRQLSSYNAFDREGKTVSAYYKFSGDLRILIALNLDIASRIEAAFSGANNQLIVQISNGGSKVPDDKLTEYTFASQKLLDAHCRCSMFKIKLPDLKLDENPIPAGTLALIIPIIDR